MQSRYLGWYAKARTSVVGKTKSPRWRWGQSLTSSSCQPADKGALCKASLGPNKVSLDHTLSFTLSFYRSLNTPSPPAPYPHTHTHTRTLPTPTALCLLSPCRKSRRDSKHMHSDREKLELGLGQSLFSHLWPRGGSAPRLKKQVSSPQALFDAPSRWQ